MRFVTVRDLRGKPALVWKRLSVERDIVVTSNGRPVAILSAADGETLEESLSALRRARAMQAVAAMQTRAARTGKDRLSLDAVNREIAGERRRR